MERRHDMGTAAVSERRKRHCTEEINASVTVTISAGLISVVFQCYASFCFCCKYIAKLYGIGNSVLDFI